MRHDLRTGIDVEEECTTVYLEPLIHQVGGHVGMLIWDESTVCKPFNEKEHEFYQTMPEKLKQFTPEYRGIIEVELEEDTNGYLNLTACSPDALSEKFSVEHFDVSKFINKRRSTRIRLKRSGSIELESCSHMSEVFEDVERCHLDRQNPWAIRCHTSHTAKLHDSVQKKHHFILLENLACRFRFPCILDLKMGFQQHSDDATEAKRLSKIKKCQRSTSSKLGLRMCGMQVYNKSTGVFKCLSKYYGRRVDVLGFHDILLQFLDNGEIFRRELIDLFILRLKQLKEIVEKTDGARFYSSSLLLMYDGHYDSAALSDDILNDVNCAFVDTSQLCSSPDAVAASAFTITQDLLPLSATSPLSLSSSSLDTLDSTTMDCCARNRSNSVAVAPSGAPATHLTIASSATASHSGHMTHNVSSADIVELSLGEGASFCDMDKDTAQLLNRPRSITNSHSAVALTPTSPPANSSNNSSSSSVVCGTCGMTLSGGGRTSTNGFNTPKDVPPHSRVSDKSKRMSNSLVPPTVEVRMIDFEHSECASKFGAHDKQRLSYVGLDVGYITGLENLTKMLEDIKQELG